MAGSSLAPSRQIEGSMKKPPTFGSSAHIGASTQRNTKRPCGSLRTCQQDIIEGQHEAVQSIPAYQKQPSILDPDDLATRGLLRRCGGWRGRSERGGHEGDSTSEPHCRPVDVSTQPSTVPLASCFKAACSRITRNRLARHQRCNDPVAFVGERDGQKIASRPSRSIDLECTRAPLHPSHAHRPPGCERGDLSWKQVEVGDAIDLRVVDNTGRAVAEPDLGAHVEREAAQLAAEGAAGAPLVEQERPGRFRKGARQLRIKRRGGTIAHAPLTSASRRARREVLRRAAPSRQHLDPVILDHGIGQELFCCLFERRLGSGLVTTRNLDVKHLALAHA